MSDTRVKKLEEKVKKLEEALRKEKSKTKRKREENVSFHDDSKASNSKKIKIRPGGRHVNGVDVINPRNGKSVINIGGKRSRAFKNMVEEARQENFDLSSPSTQDLVNLLAQGQTKGLDWWDPEYIPLPVQKAASQISGVKIHDPEEDGEMVGREDTQTPVTEVETFAAKFKRYHIKMLDERYFAFSFLFFRERSNENETI